MSPWPKRRWPGRRRSILWASASWPRFWAAHQLLVQFTDLFQSGFEPAVVGQTTAHIGDLLLREADLTNDTTRITDGQDGDRMALTASTFGAAVAVANGALEQGAAKDLAGLGKTGEKPITFLD